LAIAKTIGFLAMLFTISVVTTLPTLSPMNTSPIEEVVSATLANHPQPEAANLNPTAAAAKPGPVELLREPYPDWYTVHALMLMVSSWVRVPEKLMLIGISSKSSCNRLANSSVAVCSG